MSGRYKDEIVAEKISKNEETFLLVTVKGQDQDIWSKRKNRFIQRLINAVKVVTNSEIRPNEQNAHTLRSSVISTLARVKGSSARPQIENEERSANIKKILKECSDKDRNSDESIEDEARQSVHESQRIIERLIKRGNLVIVEEDGVTYIAYDKSSD